MPVPKGNDPPARIQIQDVQPVLDCGRWPVKRSVGDVVEVTATIFRDGHDVLSASVRYKPTDAAVWQESPLEPLGNDRWRGRFTTDACGRWCFRLEAWTDRIASFQDELRRKIEGGQEDVTGELAEGAVLLGRETLTADQALAAEAGDRWGRVWSATYEVDVDRALARFGAWYELFPRSWGGFRGVERALPELARLGFDVVYFPPIHPWLREHPEWFNRRPDGTLKYAENPPKRYQDIYNVNWESEDWRGLWEALRDVVLFWVERGVHVFRVDNPHTKPVPFWEWLIKEVRAEEPDVVFLAEAFTRPAM